MKQSVMKHNFSNVPNVSIPRSTFDRSHGVKTSFDAGYLIPIWNELEVYPGDTINLSMTGFSRLATPIYPLMDNLWLDTFFFFVPFRLLWTNWKKFNGEQIDPGDSIDFTVPQIPINNASNETLTDYFGLPTKVGASYNVNSWAYRAYNMIWNEWFRSQDLQDSVHVDTDDGPDTYSDYTMLRRGKRHDYFTSCLPNLQKGDAVQLALGTSAPVTVDGAPGSSNTVGVYSSSAAADRQLYADGGTSDILALNTGSPANAMYADLSEATAGTINELRQAFQVQAVLEKDQRSGSRYTELIQSHFGVTSPDARVQRPEYLGGGSSPIMISPVARTDSSVGVLGAQGTCGFKGHGFTKSFTEHGLILGLVNVRSDQFYQEGIDRSWSHQTRYDYYLPLLANLGEQAVLNKEIYVDATTIGAGTDDDVFGYNEAWSHLRYKKSMITGKMRSNDAASLDSWHLAPEFGSQPTLDDTFIQENPPLDRCIATPTEPHFIFDSFVDYKHTRPLPVNSIPGYIGRF